ncbi:hypothetical protein OC834_007892 [Tilletia horrida]|uniref:Tetratricopeptide SHNi-TPR domain-containing protein n=1 Tax=Tilletia horrida TaxID=155126 RepID=A0AAN6G2Y3_9BASI|nr:hypothetical protein OC842_007937 [Tilletia horrida]KAK0518017.1 hypothetical protein OC834_007892 [Tilletia horrida]KAK0541966.1 hypothetical protein OC844_007919 [Tilletia horrida]
MDLAFAALSVARQLYERVLSAPSPTLELIDGTVLTSTEISWQLANVLTDLGEYNLETESFTDAAADFQAALDVLEPVTDPLAFSRRLAEAHFQLALALEYHPDTERRTRALNHAQTTQRLLKERRGALVERRDSGTAPLPRDPSSAAAAAEGTGAANGKGKGKAAAAPARLAEDDVRTLTKEKAVLEIHEVDELLKDLDSKVEELQASVANGANGSTSSDDAVRKAIDQAFLGGAVESNPFSSTTSAANAGPANDLTTLVKKKKKPTATPAATAAASTEPAGEKRKAADEAAEPAGSKKARVDNAEDGE